ncbi:MAG: hypothetical protein IJ662_01905 [Clostridia bacterium]|nr:hypothetical protein [Clostridia bacterium]
MSMIGRRIAVGVLALLLLAGLTPFAAVAEDAAEDAAVIDTSEPIRMPDFSVLRPAADAEEAETEKKIIIHSSNAPVVKEGDVIELTGELQGFDQYTQFLYIWEVDQGDGWVEAARGSEDHYAYVASAESLDWCWRLRVLYK